MTDATKKMLTIVISLILAIVLVYWSLKGIDFDHTIQSLKQANYFYVALSVLFGITAYFLRAARWQLLLEPLGYYPKRIYAFAAICMNYFWNILIPRSGEVARCTSLYSMDKTPVDKSFGTVISERVVDLVCLIFIAILTVILKFDLILKLFEEVSTQKSGQEKSYTIYWILGIIVVMFVFSFIIFRNSMAKHPIYRRARIFLWGIRKGLSTIFMLKERKAFILYTIGIWVLYYLMTYILIFALPETSNLSMADGLYLLLVGGIGMIIPASGGLGAFHAAMRLGFIVLGLSGELGVTFAFLVHTPHTLMAFILGLLSFIVMFSAKKKAKQIN